MDYKEFNFSQLRNLYFEAPSPDKSWFYQLNNGIIVQLPNQYKLLLRWMDFDDLPFVCDLENLIFPSPWSIESFLYELDNRNYNISIVGLIAEELVAYAVSYRVADEIHISNLAVAPQFRRLKIGEILLGLSLHIGNEKKCHQAHLEVRKNNVAAIALYKKYGFKIVSIRKNYYQNEQEDALLMSRTIDMEKRHGLV